MGHTTDSILNDPDDNQCPFGAASRLSIVILVVFFGFGTWAAIAPIASAAHAPGKICVESKRQSVQHLEGGIVKTIPVRDGGYVNDWNFPRATAARIVAALGRAGVAFAELGYFRPRLSSAHPGPKCCHPEYLESMARIATAPRLLVMVHPEDVEPGDYAALAARWVWGVRFIVKAAVDHELARHVAAAREAGLRTSVASFITCPGLLGYSLWIAARAICSTWVMAPSAPRTGRLRTR